MAVHCMRTAGCQPQAAAEAEGKHVHPQAATRSGHRIAAAARPGALAAPKQPVPAREPGWNLFIRTADRDWGLVQVREPLRRHVKYACRGG